MANPLGQFLQGKKEEPEKKKKTDTANYAVINDKDTTADAKDELTPEEKYAREHGVIEKKEALTKQITEDDLQDDEEDQKKKGLLGKLFGGKNSSKRKTYDKYPHLLEVKPDECYMFASDYVKVDNTQYECVLAMFHSKGAQDKFGMFWGLSLLPKNLPPNTKVIRFEQVAKKPDEWIDEHQTRAEKVAESNRVEQGRGGTNTTKRKAGASISDLDIIAQELMNGASYLHVQYRLLVISTSLEELDQAVDLIRKGYIDAFSTFELHPYQGEQKREMSTLLRRNETKLGVGYYFTSTEYAGSYNLVTHGIEDRDGEFVGHMTGDVNNSAVLFDIDFYQKQIVIADQIFDDRYTERVHRADVWGSKIAQAALLNNHKVVHFLLSNVDMDMISPKFESFTNFVNMSKGDLNPLEMFGDKEDELSIFPHHLEKMKVITEEVSPPTDSDRTILRGSLDKVLTRYYIDEKMWYHDAQNNRERIKIVGIPHWQVPKLSGLVAHLQEQHRAEMAKPVVDPELVHALSILATIYNSVLTNHGDLFNVITKDVFDTVTQKPRVIYDFGNLLSRGKGIAMAQMINVVTYALSGLGPGDVAIFHGCENIDSQPVKDYLSKEFDFLYKRGGRTCLIYNDVAAYMRDLDFNQAIRADYTITSTMAPADADAYSKAFGVPLPESLRALITSPLAKTNYLHRGSDNVVFNPDLYVGVKASAIK